MRMFSALSGMVLLGATILLAACGGGSTNNGAGGAGGTGGAGGAGGAGPTGKQACYDYCHELDVNSCPNASDTCPADCDSLIDQYGTECEDEFGAAYACYLPFASTCEVKPAACEDAWDTAKACAAMNGCLVGQCTEGMGMNGDASCGCDALCYGKTYQTDCSTPAGGTMTCKCLVDGVEVGTCDNGDALACGVRKGCCQAEHFKIP
ncbi:hypothetical protein [Polyangium aurulentum]|uniref:hypothetical protein n=1 Tax=Polyangium aurulentum TaxID=2567896 RepID=UPI00146C01AB|nr:hypothetical protein [Polyangium aurulentum]UQA61647.1 hypothetical protein E8A73_014710 [Polyangium aurulentum]